MSAGALAIIAGEGYLPVSDATRNWLRSHNLSSDEVLIIEARTAGRNGDPTKAIAIYRGLLYRDPANPYRWCDYGEALADVTSLDEARHAFERAAYLGPFLPPILIRAANFYFSINDAKAAVPLYGKVLTIVHDYDAIIFLNLGRMGLSPEDVLNILPRDPTTAGNYLSFLINTGNAAGSDKAWEWLRKNDLSEDTVAARYVDFLINKDRIETAAKVWAEQAGKRRGDYLRPNHVFNGGFESEPSMSRLDWQIQSPEGAQAAIVPEGEHGGRCLRIDFAGETNVSFAHVIQTVWLPAGKYQFRSRVRSDGLTTNKGLQFRIQCAKPVFEWESEPILGTHSWFTVEQVIAMPACPAPAVYIVRRPSEKIDNKIQGTAWIDDISIAPVGG